MADLETMPPQKRRITIGASATLGAAAFYAGDKLGWLARHITGDPLTQATTALVNAPLAFQDLTPSLHTGDLAVGAIAGGGTALAVFSKLKGKRKFREGREYGSARWGTPADLKGFTAKIKYDNLILSSTESLAITDDGIDQSHRRNKNVLVVGGSGSGKSRFYVTPNLMQASPRASYVVTDPKGTLVRQVGTLLQEKGFDVKVVDLVHMDRSARYNPLSNVRSDEDVLTLVNAIIENTQPEGSTGTDDFWVKAERLYLCALISYVTTQMPPDERNMSSVLEMVNASGAREEDEDWQSPVDRDFEQLEAEDPNCFAVRQYKKYKMAAGKTAKSVLISVGARMAPFDIERLRDLMEYDELELGSIGSKPTALFIVTSDSNSTFDFVADVLYTQMFQALLKRADDTSEGKLPRHVHFFLDEFANLGKIPDFDRLIATIRSRNMSCSVILQSLSQLKSVYKDAAEVIQGNCDTTVFLGGQEPSTLKDMSEALGRETIDLINESDTRGTNRSYGQNFQRLGRELMTRDELAVMPNDRCIVQIRGLRPFYSKKYDLKRHPRYALLAEAGGKPFVQAQRLAPGEFIPDEDEAYELFEGEFPEI